MSLHSFTKNDLLTCFKAGNKWMDRDTEPVDNLIDVLQPGTLSNSEFPGSQLDDNDEVKQRINYIIGKHILKGKTERKTWHAYLKIINIKKQAINSAEEPQDLFFKRRTRSSTFSIT
ncbi:uncharacterized protein LALA0_S02e10088g [Lachancea lanzarotensis]|uniref:LALA0S02e10088g1_1 n=1 Tax=Lachancea lanzarotensis TaxID=1245769 RepID=A0A0C7N3Q9_9SACH|nr:uncharacterized protein LALA0_S02e10088g [Lachancea lanzarotensis]CEP61249.1 LALA0S02e10088g1_1 [Lachancea lanzarotensis]